MKVQQLIFPFSSPMIQLNKIKNLQIGIEQPKIVPISELDIYDNFKIIVNINNNDYTLTDKEMLEFYDLNFTDFKINFSGVNKYTIIDLAYEDAD